MVKEVPTVGTITDVDGNYELQVPSSATALIFSYTGFDTQEIALGNSNMVDVTLAEGKILDEVVIVGYGSQSKKDVTGSISKVSGESVANLVTPSFVQQLAGRAAGVQVQNTSGILGSAPQVRIRVSTPFHPAHNLCMLWMECPYSVAMLAVLPLPMHWAISTLMTSSRSKF